MSTKITVIDAPMGKGKTTAIIQKMSNDEENKYIYITPYLSEVERIKESCKNKKFIEPQCYGTKTKGLEYLILNNNNIVTTHSLFKYATEELKTLLKSNQYILCLDEVMQVIEEIPIRKGDLQLLLQNQLITISGNGLVKWNEEQESFDSRYNDIKQMCKNNNVYLIRGKMLIWLFPVEIFDLFEEVYILTYMFNGQIQKYYYDLFNVQYEYYHIQQQQESYSLVEGYNNYNYGYEYKDLIHILDDSKLNAIGEVKYSLSSSWFNKRENDILIKQLKKNITNFFINKTKSPSHNNLWTTFKDHQKKLSGKGYARSFISIGTRATNEYSDRHNLAYCVNIFLNPMIIGFFQDNKIELNENAYSLSELLQWIFRSAIRNNEEINLYIPSERMRLLLIKWLGV